MARRVRRTVSGTNGNDGMHHAARHAGYRLLRHPYHPQAIFSSDELHAVHNRALDLLETLGIRFPLVDAQELFTAAGATVKDDMVFIGRDIVDAALDSAPSTFTIRAPNPKRDIPLDQKALIFSPAGGCPNVYDRERGRRPGDSTSYIEAAKLSQVFDVIHKQTVAPEPQDIALQERHIFMTEAQLTYGDKPLALYARGPGQVEQSFALICAALYLDEAQFSANIYASTVINSNSPRIFDLPMAKGIIDFARAGQLSIITPFCLAGAMAPISVEGALLLQHAECLAGITLSQLARPGAPVCYGGFGSNVDMKSGSPAFGTPEHVRMQIGSGQLARHIGLPWRSAAGAAANIADAQGAQENANGLWGAMNANANLVLHAAGWLEGGLTFGFEKFVTDLETLQSLAELCTAPTIDSPDEAYDAIAGVQPGGHFFDSPHTMARYATAFYEPLNADLSNHGTWSDAGGLSADERATKKWQDALTTYHQPDGCAERAERLAPLAAQFRANGGALPLGG